MDYGVVALVVAAAAMHAGWNILAKVSGDPLLATGAFSLVMGLVSLALLPFFPVPHAASWPYLATSAVLHIGYKLFLSRAYRHGDLGHVYPLARGLSPLLVAAGGYVFAGETLRGFNLAGFMTLTFAVMSLALGDLRRVVATGPVVAALTTGCFIAAYTLVDGLGARAAGSPHSYAVWLFAVDSFPLAAIAVQRRREQLRAAAPRLWPLGLLGGLMMLGAYWLVIYAMSLQPLALIAALRETSVVLAAVIGVWLLKEPFVARRFVAAIAVALGVILIQA